MSTTLLESVGINSKVENKIQNIWKEKNLELNLPVIDLQHLWLIFLLVETEETLGKQNEAIEFHQISIELVNYAIEHFSLEEMLFLKYDYPEYASHKKSHQKFIETIKEKFNAENLKNESQRKELVQFLWDWLAKHIMYEDKLYKQFLDAKYIDPSDWLRTLLDEHQVAIDRAQLELYNKVTKVSQITDIVSENIYRSINNIWHVYNLSTGIPIVDLQHIWLIRMTLELDTACKNMVSKKREDVFRSIVKGAVQYAKDHFTVEEKIMQKFHYAGFAKHYKQHQGFLDFVQLRFKEYKEGDIKAASNLVMDLKEWLLSHIAIEDKNMGVGLRDFHGDVIMFTSEIIKSGELKIKKNQVELYNKIMGIK